MYAVSVGEIDTQIAGILPETKEAALHGNRLGHCWTVVTTWGQSSLIQNPSSLRPKRAREVRNNVMLNDFFESRGIVHHE